MNKLIIIFFLSLLLVNCTSNTILDKPKDLISKEQMVDLITDLFLANEAKGIKNDKLERNINYAPLVFEKYKIDSSRFKESNLYYTSKIDEYNEILNDVDKRLKLLVAQFEKEIEEKDSIERAIRFSKSKNAIKKSEKEELEDIEQ